MSAGASRQTLGALQRAMAQRFAQANVATPMLDARVLVCAAAGLSPEQLIMLENEQVRSRDLKCLLIWGAARCAGMPVSRLTGRRAFFGLDFDIGPAVLDPRADTETLVEAALELMPARARVLDLGTGSGCVLISVLAHALDARGLGVDISAGALRLARQNAHLHNVRNRIGLRQGSWFSRVSGRFDIIVSNPPYIVRGEIDHLATEVRAHDPRRALDGGPDGLDAYRDIAVHLRNLLVKNGYFIGEFGIGQGPAVGQILCAAGLQVIGFRNDMVGRKRCIIARRPD